MVNVIALKIYDINDWAGGPDGFTRADEGISEKTGGVAGAI
jgi:hypothetical protein